MARALLVVLLVSVMGGVCFAAKVPAQIPELTQPIIVDGDLSDWKGGVSAPVWAESDICYVRSGYQWCGPEDISMEMYLGWRPEGLCFAAVVADDKVQNLRTDGATYWEDSIGFYVDGRAGSEFGKSEYTRGSWQVTITPPLPGRAIEVGANGLIGGEERLTVAGKATPAGYTIEVLIPWDTLPGITPKVGAVIGFNAGLNDYDGDNPTEERPIQLNAGGAKDLYLYPDRLTRWELVKTLRTGEEVTLGPLVDFPFPSVAAAGVLPKLVATVGTVLSPRVGSVRFTATDWRGAVLLDRTVKVSPAPAPWSSAVQAALEWPSDVPLPSGTAAVAAVVNDRDGKPLGAATRRLLVQR